MTLSGNMNFIDARDCCFMAFTNRRTIIPFERADSEDAHRPAFLPCDCRPSPRNRSSRCRGIRTVSVPGAPRSIRASRQRLYERRYSCIPLEWYENTRGWKDRTRLFVETAVDLLCEAAAQALSRGHLHPEQIDGVVTISSTGLAVPSLDALVMESMPFRRDLQRFPIFGFVCGGGVLGLSRVATLARA